jgi:hypothetical protein
MCFSLTVYKCDVDLLQTALTLTLNRLYGFLPHKIDAISEQNDVYVFAP